MESHWNEWKINLVNLYYDPGVSCDKDKKEIF